MYYRKKHSLYLLTSCHLQSELKQISSLTYDLFDRPTSSKLLTIRDLIKKLIVFVEKLTTYSDGERKPKNSIWIDDKKFIIEQLKKINENIVNSLTAKNKILCGADVLDNLYELMKFIYLKQVYWYNSKLERESKYSNYFAGLKLTNRKVEF